MNIQEYISSGVLELYAMQQLPTTEQAEVEKLRLEYPEVNSEILKIESSMQEFAFTQAKTPPARLKANILNRINNLQTQEIHKTQSPELEPEAQNPSSLVPRPSSFPLWVVAASVALAIAAGAWGLNQSSAAKANASSLTSCQEENQTLIHQLKAFRDPAFKKVVLPAKDTKQTYAVVAYWNPQTQALAIDASLMPPVLNKDKQYQLWAIVGGKPVDAGVFDPSQAIIEMKSINNASAFAVTVEKRGGSPTPTMEEMKVIGKV